MPGREQAARKGGVTVIAAASGGHHTYTSYHSSSLLCHRLVQVLAGLQRPKMESLLLVLHVYSQQQGKVGHGWARHS